MVNGDDNNVKEKTDQTDLSDEGALKPSDEENTPQEEALKSETTSTDTHADAVQESGDTHADAVQESGDTHADAVQESGDTHVDAAQESGDIHADAAQESGDSMESVMNLYEESFKRFAEGEVVTGRIISIDKDHILVDIGYKSEGQIRIQEFKNEEGEITAQLGDSVEVMVEWWDDEEERVVLSKEKAANIKIWDAIKKNPTTRMEQLKASFPIG